MQGGTCPNGYRNLLELSKLSHIGAAINTGLHGLHGLHVSCQLGPGAAMRIVAAKYR